MTFSYPYLETKAPDHVDLGGRLGLIYGSFSIVSVIFAYCFIPETRRLELEDIDAKFNKDEVKEIKVIQKGLGLTEVIPE